MLKTKSSYERWRDFCKNVGVVYISDSQFDTILSIARVANMDFLRRSGDSMMPFMNIEQYELVVERKRGDCSSIPGWDTKNCCSSCHDPSRSDTDLVNVNGKRICCHASRWEKAEDVERLRNEISTAHS